MVAGLVLTGIGIIDLNTALRAQSGDDSTIVVWRDREALLSYRNGELIKEAIAFEKEYGQQTTREAYPLKVAL